MQVEKIKQKYLQYYTLHIKLNIGLDKMFEIVLKQQKISNGLIRFFTHSLDLRYLLLSLQEYFTSMNNVEFKKMEVFQ